MNNQEAFDIAVLHLLNQAHGCMSSGGTGQYRGTKGGKSGLGALIPDRLYSSSMEGKTIHQVLAAAGPAKDELREHLKGVSPRLPSLFRDIVLDGCPRVAQNFSLSLRIVRVWKMYRKLPGPQMVPRTKPAVPQPVLVLSPQFGTEKREHSKGSLDSVATA